MGTFTDNLLKLTEFPFSYSLIPLLVLISTGQPLFGLSTEELGAKIGGLLILMGFVATTLSITDPVGALQKRILLGSLSSEEDVSKIVLKVARHTQDSDAVTNFERLGQYSGPLICLFREFSSVFESVKPVGSLEDLLNKLDPKKISYLHAILLSLKRTTVRTPWMQREIDKITSMGYFVVVILVFIVAVRTVPGLIDKFVITLQADNEPAVNHIREALSAAEASDKQRAIAEINSALEALSQVEEPVLWAQGVIIGFSIGAFVLVSYKLYKHSRHLRSYAFTTFLYLVAQEAIKIERTNFDKSLENIEKYLDNSDWPMAELSVRRLLDDYTDVVEKEWDKRREQIKKEEKAKDVEKKHDSRHGALIYYPYC
jgi:hypothetical protein